MVYGEVVAQRSPAAALGGLHTAGNSFPAGLPRTERAKEARAEAQAAVMQ
jgi:hypothetical protein